MRKKSYVQIIFIIVLVAVSFSLFTACQKENQTLIYVKENSMHSDFLIEDGYVVVRDSISVKNISNEDIYFYMSADMCEDNGFVTEKIVSACKEGTLEKERFFIKANSEQLYSVNFRAPKGDKKTKSDRLPPKEIKFEIIK